jgi:hypothetical protein
MSGTGIMPVHSRMSVPTMLLRPTLHLPIDRASLAFPGSPLKSFATEQSCNSESISRRTHA